MPVVDNPPIEKEDVVAPATKPVIGIIYPPPEVRNIVDKTASFVARNGPEFETRIRQNELNNPKFNFLTPTDPYHAYYKHKVKEFHEGRGVEPSSAPKMGFGIMVQKTPAIEQLKAAIEPQVPREPPPEFEFIADPPSISAFDLDMVKLTAQFVARNGRQFLTNLMKRESHNYQYDFLRPQHSLFNYFTKLVEQYTKVLIPPKDLLAKLKKESENPKAALEQAKYRVEWAKFQERERKREEDEREKERVAYASIDWHDFVVVETVDYQSAESGNLPPPTTPDEVGARVLQQQRFDDGVPTSALGELELGDEGSGDEEPLDEDRDEQEEDEENEDEFDEEDEVMTRRANVPPPSAARPSVPPPPPPAPPVGADTRVQDMEEDSEPESGGEDSDVEPSAPPPLPPMPAPRDVGPKLPPLPPNPEQVVIRKDYDPKAPKFAESSLPSDKFLRSPITGELIPADKIQEHMRIGLLDPKWIEQRDRAIQEKREQEEVYAPGSAIGDQLKHLAERRTDIFGIGTEETQIGKKIGEEEKKEKAKVIWDGHSASMEKVSQKARENITIEDQIAGIHKVKGLVADEEKEKIGPAMPKVPSTQQPLLPPPQSVAPPTTQPVPPVTKPPLPPNPAASVPPPPAPMAARPPAPLQPVRPAAPVAPVAPLPPRLPMVGGVVSVPVPVQPGLMMIPQPGQPPLAQGVLGPRPPIIVPPMVPPAFVPGMAMPPMMPPAPPPMQPPAPPRPHDSAGDDEPPSKRQKTEDQLIPEFDFLAAHANKGPVTFRVVVPNSADKSEWKLVGQSFTITLPLTDTVSVIKAKMFDELGMPVGKQKLQLEGMFMKDSNSLAFYNFAPNCVVQLQVKERGGRKK